MTLKTIVMKNQKLNRQQFAYKCVIDNKNKDFKNAVEKAGMIILKNGLISALANIKANEKKLYKCISEWLKKENFPLGFDNNEDLLKNLLACDSQTLLVLTEEVLLLTDALKEFCKAELKD